MSPFFTRIKILLLTVLLLGLFLLPTEAFASETDGIIPANSYAWGENIGWINFGSVNGNIHVTDTAVTGFAWSANYGWINLSPINGGVTNTCTGTLGGNAWSSGLGWISFSGVTIDAAGKFTGLAGTSGSTAGQINFSCANCSVTTDWKQCSLRTTSSQTSASTTSTTASSVSSTTDVCTAGKPAGAPTISSAVTDANSVTLTWTSGSGSLTHYLVAYGTSPGSIQYGNPNVGNATSYTISGLSGGTTYYFKVKAINNCMPGDFSNEVSAAVSGAAITTGEAPAEGFVPAAEIPSQLFDIALIIDDPLIEDSRTLSARVTFTSFGTEDTPVDMEFIVLDENSRELYKTTGKTVIQTEGLYNQVFADLVIPDGNYALLLRTSYGDNVRDEFRQPFEVRGQLGWLDIVCRQVWWIVPLEVLIIVLLLWKRRRGKGEESYA